MRKRTTDRWKNGRMDQAREREKEKEREREKEKKRERERGGGGTDKMTDARTDKTKHQQNRKLMSK